MTEKAWGKAQSYQRTEARSTGEGPKVSLDIERSKNPQFFPQILNYISFGSGLRCLFIAFAAYLLIKIFPVSTVEIFKAITDLLISFN